MLQQRRPRITDKQKEQIVKAYGGDMTIRAISKKYHVAVATIYRIIKEYVI